jgi:hypothetical protein
MSTLYRHAVTVTRKQPYIAWANSFDDSVTLSEDLANQRRTVYLVAIEARFDPAKILDANWPVLFEEELAAWMENEADWPSPRTRAMFDQWFEAEITECVFDLDPGELLTEDEIEMADLAHASHTCAWCELALDDGEGRTTGFALPDREPLAAREGLVLPVIVDRETVLVGIMKPRDSEEARAGTDLVFHVCSSRCEKALRKFVPKALRRMTAAP